MCTGASPWPRTNETAPSSPTRGVIPGEPSRQRQVSRALALIDRQELLGLLRGDDDRLAAELGSAGGAAGEPCPVGATGRRRHAERDARLGPATSNPLRSISTSTPVGGPPGERGVRLRGAEERRGEAGGRAGSARRRPAFAWTVTIETTAKTQASRPRTVVCRMDDCPRFCARDAALAGRRCSWRARHFQYTFSPLRVGRGSAGRYEFRMSRRNHSHE